MKSFLTTRRWQRLNEIIAEWTARHTKQEATDILARAGVPAGALLDIDDIAHDPQYTESGIVVEVEHPYRGKLKMPGFAARMSENHIEYQCSPELGGETTKRFMAGCWDFPKMSSQFSRKRM